MKRFRFVQVTPAKKCNFFTKCNFVTIFYKDSYRCKTKTQALNPGL